MNIVESWKKQITFLQNKDARTVFSLAFKRQLRVLLSVLGYFLLAGLFVAGYRHDNIFFHPNNALLAFAIFLTVLFLRPSIYKKDWNYLFYVTKKRFFTILILSFLASLVPMIVYVPFVLFSSIFILLSLDGEYRIKNTFALIKKAGLFFLYTLPTMVILSCVLLISMELLKYIMVPYTWGFAVSFLLFPLVLVISLILFMFVYTVDVYEHEQLYFESSQEKI